MKHIIVFFYVFTILIGVSALTIQWLASKGDKKRLYGFMKPFIGMLLVMNMYDFFIYYNDNIIDQASGNILISVGDCLIAILVLLWLNTEVKICGDESCKWIVKAAGMYAVVYFVIWLAAIIFFIEYSWIRLVIDIPLICMLIAGSILCIVKGIKSHDHPMMISYKAVITIFMAVNYMTYFISESGMVRDSNETIMDLTIFYWLVINIANLILLYKRDFSNSYLSVTSYGVDLEEALTAVRQQYDLTVREGEILKEIYDGKTNVQIGEKLFISESTVKAHIYNIFRKMDVKNRIEIVCIIRGEKEKNN